MLFGLRRPALNGVFGVFKKPGVRSQQVVRNVHECMIISGHHDKARVGHGGTLDEAARGVLVVGLGYGCKELEKFLAGPRTYRVTGQFGILTDSLDASGQMLYQMPYHHIRRSDLEHCLTKFVGSTQQVPPALSVMQSHGKRARERAESGEDVNRPPRTVHVSSISLLSLNLPNFSIEVSCSGKFYIRALIRDIGESVHCCAHAVDVLRASQGMFTCRVHQLISSDAITYEAIERAIFNVQNRILAHVKTPKSIYTQ